MSDGGNDLVVMATVGAPVGVRGEVRVKPYADDPAALRGYSPFLLPDGRALHLLAARPQKQMLVCRFRGVDTREAAAALTNLDLAVPRNRLPEPDKDELYLDDLVGLAVRGLADEPMGEVVAAQDFGAGDILEVKPPGGRTAMIPFSEAAVPELDIESGWLRVDPVAAGLVDEDTDAPSSPPGEKVSRSDG